MELTHSICEVDFATMEAEYDRATNPLIAEVVAESPELFLGWSQSEWDQLYSLHGVGGALRAEGIREAAVQIQRQREILGRLQVVLETHLGELAGELIDAMFRLVQVAPLDLQRKAGWQPPPRNSQPGSKAAPRIVRGSRD